MKKKNAGFVKLTDFISKMFAKSDIIAFEPFTVETDGFSFVNVKGCLGINEYTDERVILVCEKVTALISGKDLNIAVFSFEDTHVSGAVKGIEFIYKGKGEIQC